MDLEVTYALKPNTNLMKMKHWTEEIYCRLVLSLKGSEACCHVAHFQKQHKPLVPFGTDSLGNAA